MLLEQIGHFTARYMAKISPTLSKTQTDGKRNNIAGEHANCNNWRIFTFVFATTFIFMTSSMQPVAHMVKA